MTAHSLARTIQFFGVREFRDEAHALLVSPGDAVLIERGSPRALVLKCPDGCGETLAINLDPRAGKAWRLHRAPINGISLYPSLWKNDGCQSHFVIRRSQIIWCESDYDDEFDEATRPDAALKTFSLETRNSRREPGVKLLSIHARGDGRSVSNRLNGLVRKISAAIEKRRKRLFKK